MTYQQVLDYLYERLPVFHLTGGSAYKPGLDNTIQLLHALGNPHQKFKSIHIAGTNGKGSVSHLLAAVFQQAGYSTGLYTSPHLVDFGERIRINGQMISQEFVINFVEKQKELIEKVQPSFFELTMAMAFEYFASQHVDIVVVETGLGGRLDSTNIVSPELSVITNIGLDHTEFLGNSLELIAFEKAGIIKPTIPAVIGEVLPETLPVFEKKAAETASTLIFAEKSYPVEYLRNDSNYLWFRYKDNEYASGLTALYQLKNIQTVLAAVDYLNHQQFELNMNAVKEGLAEVCTITGLRGRWEKIADKPLIIADTGHNVQGIQAVVQQIGLTDAKTVHIIIGMVNDKDINGVLDILPTSALYYFTNADVKRALPSNELQQMATKYGLRGNAYSTVTLAIRDAKANASEDDLILITGSNFVVGEALALI